MNLPVQTNKTILPKIRFAEKRTVFQSKDSNLNQIRKSKTSTRSSTRKQKCWRTIPAMKRCGRPRWAPTIQWSPSFTRRPKTTWPAMWRRPPSATSTLTCNGRHSWAMATPSIRAPIEPVTPWLAMCQSREMPWRCLKRYGFVNFILVIEARAEISVVIY